MTPDTALIFASTAGLVPAVPWHGYVRVAFFYGLLAAVLVVAWQRGRTDERLAALVCVAGTLLTVGVGGEMASRFSQFDARAFAIDLSVFLAFLAIALQSDRFWPLWAAGLQLIGTTVHLLRLLDYEMIGLVFGTALALWSYPILLAVGVGAWRTEMIERWRRAELASREPIT